MKEKTRKGTAAASDAFAEFEDHELKSTMDDFLKEERKENTNIWNFATVTGIAMFFVAMLYMLQVVGLSIGPDLGGLITALPVIGAGLIALVGFGYLTGDRRRVKRQRKKEKREHRNKQKQAFGGFDFDSGSGSRRGSRTEEFELENDLDRSDSRGSSGARAFDFDDYALRKSKKLYKSRTDRKLAGVCGGLSKYFGISSTVIRMLFVIFTFAGWGAPVLAYIALMIALDKEPPELMDDFDF